MIVALLLWIFGSIQIDRSYCFVEFDPVYRVKLFMSAGV